MEFQELAVSGAYRFISAAAGPHVLCFGGIHGDEPCGVWAIQKLMDNVKNGAVKPLGGTLTLVIANKLALNKNVRFVDQNLNRLFKEAPREARDNYESLRAAELMPLILQANFFLDLHSTSSKTEPFITCESKYLAAAKKLGVRNIVVGWGDLLAKSTLGDTETFAVNHGVTAFTMECGAHQDETSKRVAYETLIKFLTFAGILELPAPPLPETSVFRLFHVEECQDISFQFEREFQNFNLLKKNELIGRDSSRQHLSPSDCCLVLPAFRKIRLIGEALYYLAYEDCASTTNPQIP